MARIRVKVTGTRTVRTAVVRRRINRPLTKLEWERLLGKRGGVRCAAASALCGGLRGPRIFRRWATVFSRFS